MNESSVASVTVCVSVCVRTSKGKWLDLSTPDSVQMYSVAVAQHALTGGQRSRSHGYKNRHGRMAAGGAVAIVLLLPVWDCTSYDCLGWCYEGTEGW